VDGGRGSRAPLLAPSWHAVIGALVHPPWESRRVGLTYMADRWAWSPVVVKAVLGTRGSEPFLILGMPRSIPGVVHEWSSPHILGCISSEAPSTTCFTRPFHSLPQLGVAMPFLACLLSHLNLLA
jgi:hypothetical protein